MDSKTGRAPVFPAGPARRTAFIALLCAVFSLVALSGFASVALDADLRFEESDNFTQEGLNGPETFPVTITVAGDSRVEFVAPETVAQILKRFDVEVRGQDLVTPAMDTVVSEFDEIVVERREKETFREEQELPYETLYYHSPEVLPGQEVVAVEGSPGLKVETWTRFLVRGEIQDETLESSDILRQPVNREVKIGFQSRPVSGLDFKWSFNEDGEPVGYTNVVRGGKSSGYSAGAGAATASGRPAMVGHVAVNPNVIPYGSKLFIQSPDGSFVYGYAIAADTGTALMQARVDVDLYYDNYAQSAANGIREVDIYILE